MPKMATASSLTQSLILSTWKKVCFHCLKCHNCHTFFKKPHFLWVDIFSCNSSSSVLPKNTFLPNAQITFDKFHILKVINDAVDTVRRMESKGYAVLKGTRYLWLKNHINLTQKQKEKLEELSLSKIRLKTLKAYQIRERFQEIYQAKTLDEFVTYLKKWYYWATHSKIPQIIEAAKTIKRHWQGVNYFESRISNGILEGLNSLIQAAKAKARGYKTFRNFKIMIYLLTAKLDFGWGYSDLRKT